MAPGMKPSSVARLVLLQISSVAFLGCKDTLLFAFLSTGYRCWATQPYCPQSEGVTASLNVLSHSFLFPSCEQGKRSAGSVQTAKPTKCCSATPGSKGRRGTCTARPSPDVRSISSFSCRSPHSLTHLRNSKVGRWALRNRGS